MITRCVAVVLVAAGCAWGLAGCNKTPKADAAYKQNAQAIITALEKVKADVDNKSPPAVLTKDYTDAQAARKTWDAALTPEQKEMDATNALNYALSRYGVVLQVGGGAASRNDPHMKAQDPVSTAAAALDKAKQAVAALP
jgi:hypothetical protein